MPTYMTNYTIFDCCTCGGPIALTTSQEKSLRQTRATFMCPKGHSQHFPGPTEEEKRIKLLEGTIRDLRSDLESAYDRIGELSVEAAAFRCPNPHCSYSSPVKKRLRDHMITCEHRPPKALPANAGPNATNARVH